MGAGERGGLSVELLFFDLDGFKHFNDKYGHAAGDQALKMIAAELQQVGGGGRSFRYGGEEFAVLFPSTSPAEAREPLDEVRLAIADRKFALRAPDRPRKKPDTPAKRATHPRLIRVTVSVGVAGPNPRRGGARHDADCGSIRPCDRPGPRAATASACRSSLTALSNCFAAAAVLASARSLATSGSFWPAAPPSAKSSSSISTVSSSPMATRPRARDCWKPRSA